MLSYTLKFIFTENKFKVKIWDYENLEIEDIHYCYDYLPSMLLFF